MDVKKCYLTGLEITEAGSYVIVSGVDYYGKDFGGNLPREIAREEKLEVNLHGGAKENGDIIANVSAARGKFNRGVVPVNEKDLIFE